MSTPFHKQRFEIGDVVTIIGCKNFEDLNGLEAEVIGGFEPRMCYVDEARTRLVKLAGYQIKLKIGPIFTAPPPTLRRRRPPIAPQAGVSWEICGWEPIRNWVPHKKSELALI